MATRRNASPRDDPLSPGVSLLHSDVPQDSDDEVPEDGVVERWESSANKMFNSLDFDDVENELVVEQRKKSVDDESHWLFQVKVWVIIAIVGVLTAFVAYGIDKGIEYLMLIKFKAVEHFMQAPEPASYNETTVQLVNGTEVMINVTRYGVTEPIPFAAPFFLYTLINLVYVSVAAALVIFGEPVARGSGIGEIKCYLNGVRIFRVVRIKTLFCKAVGILFSVASGLPCGKEGPMIHSGAAIASGVATGKSSRLGCDTGFFREFRNDKFKRQFVTAGAAAGVGAAFGAPVGGLLFAVEEVGSFWSLDLTVKVFVCSAITPWVLQFLLEPKDYNNASIRGLIDFGEVKGGYNYGEVPFVALLGVLGGLIGGLFIWLNLVITKWRRRYVTTKPARFVEVLLVNGLTSVVLITLVLRGYRCVSDANVIPSNRDSLQRYGCPPGEFNDMATYFFRSMEDSIHVLIHTEHDIPIETLVVQMVPYFLLTVLTYGIYVPSGLFLPNLALGASFGHLYAQLWNQALGTNFLSPARFAVYGGTAVLCGVVRMTISVIVIVMEATGNTGLFYPLVIITLAAKLVGDRFTISVYEAHIELANIPLLGNALEDPRTTRLVAEQVMNQDFVPVPSITSVYHLKRVLQKNPFNNALVVHEASTNRFEGLLLRRAAIILIAKKAWRNRLSLQDFVKSDKERAYIRVRKSGIIDIEEADKERFIDLHPYMDKWPHTVQQSTPLPRVFRTFRELGLRHIIVLDPERKPVGMIGRKQLTHLHPATDAPPEDKGYGTLRADERGSSPDLSNSETLHTMPGEENTSSPRQQQHLSVATGLQSVSGAGSSRRLGAGNSPSTSMKRVLTSEQLVSSFRNRMTTDGNDEEWRDSHIRNVT